MRCPLQRLGDKLILQALPQEKKEGLLIVPDNNNEPIKCRIVSGFDFDEPEQDDIVLIERYHGRRFMYEGNEYIVIKCEDIICKILPEKTNE